jgi:hypothetical protein
VLLKALLVFYYENCLEEQGGALRETKHPTSSKEIKTKKHKQRAKSFKERGITKWLRQSKIVGLIDSSLNQKLKRTTHLSGLSATL